MDVADLSDAETVESSGEVRDGKGLGDEIDLVSGDLSGIEGKTCRRGSRADEKVAAGKARRWDGGGAGHRS